MILPGATLGMLGGGQLGRMFTMAARTMGYRVVILDPDLNSPAGQVADEHLHAAYNDEWALEQMANICDAVTTEFENVPASSLRKLETHCKVHPKAHVLKLTQDRIREKSFITDRGFPTVPFQPIYSTKDIKTACSHLAPPFILKRSSFGYDGKGQASVDDRDSAVRAFAALGHVPCVLEQKVELAREISVVLGRSVKGSTVCFPVAENEHRQGILHMSIIPARIAATVAQRATEMAAKVAHALEYVGVMAVEFFETRCGELLINEIAPRPHNSGHYTLDACVTSQFEQQVRMVCDLPAGDTRLLTPVVMVNILGDVWQREDPRWDMLLGHPNAKLHLYGKLKPRSGRKMGHFCYLDEDLERAQQKAGEILAWLG
jgi:5-(carboxyamino)imidazole ribonucleotide synthase